MQIEVVTRRSDIVRLNLLRVLVFPSILRPILIWWAVIAFFLWTKSRNAPFGPDWGALLTHSLLFALAAALAGMSIMLLLTFLGATEKNGMAGRKRFSLEPEGLREMSDSNDVLHYWSAIERIEEKGGGLMILLKSRHFYFLPRRDFKDTQHFENFAESLRSKWRNAC